MSKVRFVDLDRTLAYYDKWEGATVIGNPILKMKQKVESWVSNGDKIVIFTARVSPKSRYTKPEECEVAKKAVEEWCDKHFGIKFEVTCEKEFLDVIYDDRAVHICVNEGVTFEEKLLTNILEMRELSCSDSDILFWIEDSLEDIIKKQNE
jgi:hypothetical protein